MKLRFIEEHDVVVAFHSDNDNVPYSFDGTVNQILGTITNVYPSPVDLPPDTPYLIIGIAVVGVVVVVALVIKARR